MFSAALGGAVSAMISASDSSWGYSSKSNSWGYSSEKTSDSEETEQAEEEETDSNLSGNDIGRLLSSVFECPHRFVLLHFNKAAIVIVPMAREISSKDGLFIDSGFGRRLWRFREDVETYGLRQQLFCDIYKNTYCFREDVSVLQKFVRIGTVFVPASFLQDIQVSICKHCDNQDIDTKVVAAPSSWLEKTGPYKDQPESEKGE